MSFYVTSDLHGCMENYNQILSFLKPEDRVFFLGDACDRGKDGWELIKLILLNPQFIYLKGNHEDMTVKEYEAYCQSSGPYYDRYDNRATYKAILKDSNAQFWIDQIKALPLSYTYYNRDGKSILLSHAGYTPTMRNKLPSEHDLLWNRMHHGEAWDEVLNKNSIIVHGHTCVQSLAHKYKSMADAKKHIGAYWYCNGHKVDIDNGVFLTGRTILLNLDTWEEKIFQAKDMSVFDF